MTIADSRPLVTLRGACSIVRLSGEPRDERRNPRGAETGTLRHCCPAFANGRHLRGLAPRYASVARSKRPVPATVVRLPALEYFRHATRKLCLGNKVKHPEARCRDLGVIHSDRSTRPAQLFKALLKKDLPRKEGLTRNEKQGKREPML